MSEEHQPETNENESLDEANSAATEIPVPNAKIGMEDILKTLPEDLKEEKSLQNFKSTEDLVKSYIHAQRQLGSSIRIPSEHSSDEDKSKFYEKLTSIDGVVKLPSNDNKEEVRDFYKRLGMPEDPSGYSELVENSDIVDKEHLADTLKAYHDAGLTKNQAKALLDVQMGALEKDLEQKKAKESEMVDYLTSKWGEQYVTRKHIADSAVELLAKDFGADNIPEEVRNNPVFIDAMYRAGSTMMESNEMKGPITGQFKESPEEANHRVTEILQNPDHPFHKKDHPDHEQAQREYVRLVKLAYNS